MADNENISINAKTTTYYNRRPEDKYKFQIKYVDATTGENVDINSFTDSIRLARAGANIRDIPSKLDTIVHKEPMPTDLLSNFVTTPSENYSPSDAVSALGLYITDYIVDRITTLGDKNSDLSKNDDSIVDTMTFRDYIKGGMADYYNALSNTNEEIDIDYNNTKINEAKEMSASAKRIAAHAGIGLGESYVLNPTYQFNKRDDPRTNPMYTKIGRVYSTQLMKNWPIALFQPGRFVYHTSFFKLMGLGSGSGVQESLIRSGGDGLGATLLKFISAPIDALTVVGTVGSAIFGGNKVLEFKQAYNLFNQYARYLYTTVASMMGLVEAGKYVGARKSLNLYDILPTKILGDSALKYKNNQYIPFRCGKGITTNESFNNATTSNPIEEEMNSQAEKSDPNAGGAEAQAAASGNPMGVITSFAKRIGMTTLGNFSEQALVLSGRGRISLPEVFSSSSFSRSFSFDFKFHSPYGDVLSIFENCYIPFLTLLAMTAPRQIGKMSYTSPFAVRISVKNKIMINYGMIESLSVTRGGDSNDWTPAGYPKTLTVTISVKDLEPNISLPLASRGPLRAAMEAMFPSSGISEYLASIGGLTIEDIDVFFSKGRFNRASQQFTSTWNAKLNMDSLMSTVVNSSIVNNVVSLFAGTDLDNLNRSMDPFANNNETNMYGSIAFKQNAPSSFKMMSEFNGQGGNAAFDADNSANVNNVKQIGEYLNSTTIYE